MKLESTADVRNFLLDQMMKTAGGKIEAQQAKAICNLAQQVYNTMKLEMQFAQLKGKEQIGKVEPIKLSQDKPTRYLRAA